MSQWPKLLNNNNKIKDPMTSLEFYQKFKEQLTPILKFY